jgi:hypothetical protein
LWLKCSVGKTQFPEEEEQPLAATHATSRNVPAVTASMISDQISIDFVREGTGYLSSAGRIREFAKSAI